MREKREVRCGSNAAIILQTDLIDRLQICFNHVTKGFSIVPQAFSLKVGELVVYRNVEDRDFFFELQSLSGKEM